MSTRKCSDCKCPCLLVSVGCIVGQLNPFTGSTPANRVRSAIDEATREWIRPHLGETCFTELCSRLDANDLPTGDQNYVKLPDTDVELIEDYVTPLLSSGATALYIQAYGFDRLAVAPDSRDHKAFLDRLFSSTYKAESALKRFLESNKTYYTCLATSEDDSCATEETGIESQFGDFVVSTKYPSRNRPRRPGGFEYGDSYY